MARLADLHPPAPHSEPPPERGGETPRHPADRPSRPRSGIFILALIVAAIVVVTVAAELHSRVSAEASLAKATRDAAVLSVYVVHPSLIATTDEVILPGTAQAFYDTPIYARTSGYVSSWNVDIGDHVKHGQVLAQIETPEVDQQLDQARADLKNAQANLELSQLTETRAEALYKKTAISAQERDQAVSDLAAKKALVDSGQANVRRLEQLKSFEAVTAPFDGVITARSTDIGALIQAGDAVGAKELFHLADNRTLRVYFSVPEIYAATIKPGGDVSITFDSFPGEKFPGTLARDSASLDPRTHTLNVEADVPNPSGRLFPGGYAAVHLKFPAAAGSVTIPANTLLFRAEGTRVAVVRDGQAVLTPLTIGRDHGNTLEILAGLTPNDSVILDPPDSLADGAAVRIEAAPAPN